MLETVDLLLLKLSIDFVPCNEVLPVVVVLSLKAKGSIDSPEEFAELFNSCEKLKGDKRYEVMASLRVALTNNPVR